MNFLFNFFGNKDDSTPEIIFTDRTYLSIAAKTNACITLAKEHPGTLFICWFNETLKKLRTAFIENAIDEMTVIDAKQVHSGMLQKNTAVFAEHYPLHKKELALVEHWPLQQIIVYSSMDEPLLKHFGSEKIIPLMKVLGMKEDEVIENSIVSKSIIKGQANIAALVTTEQSANSQGEWLERNLK